MSTPERGPESAVFRAWAEFVLRHRIVAFLLVVVPTVVSGWGMATRLHMDMSLESFMDSDSGALDTLHALRDQFGRDDVFVVVAEGEVFTAEYLEQLRSLHRELAGLDLELESLGQGRPVRGEAAPEKPADPLDGFGGFEEGGGEDWGDDFGEGDSADSEPVDEWAGEAGGTIVDQIISLVNFRRTRGRNATQPDGSAGVVISVGELMKPWPATTEAIAALRAEVLADSTLVGQVIDAEATTSAIIIRPWPMDESDLARTNDEILRILASHETPSFRLSLSGLPALGASLNALMQREIRNLFALAFGALFLVMLYLFRHPIGIAGPLTVVGLSSTWAFGFMAWMDMPVTMLSNVLPAFLIAVGIGDSVHIQSVYRDYRRQGVENHEAVVRAVASTGRAVLYTTLTTMFGLLSFNFASIRAATDMGNAGAFGVLCALANTITVLPIMLSWNKEGLLGAPKRGTHDLIDRFLDLCSAASGRRMTDPPGTPTNPRRRRLVLAVAIVLTITAGYGASQLRVWHNPLSWVPDDDPTKVAFEKMDSHLGGASGLQLLITANTDLGLKDLELLLAIERLEERIRAYRHPETPDLIGNATSILDVVRETNRALHGGDPAHYRLPETQAAAADTLFLFENASPSELRRLASADLKTSQLSLRLRWMEATSYGPLTHWVDDAVEELIGPLATVQPTGAAYTLFTTVSNLIWNLVKSFSIALCVITVFMMMLLRDIRLGLISMVPNLLPILYVMGFMGFAGVPVDMSNLLIASIAIGLAVDDTIHFLHRYKVNVEHHESVEEAISEALHHSGRAMVGTSLILAVGFFTYMGASLLSLQRFGYLIALTAILAVIIDLVFAPALIRTIYGGRDPAKALSPTGEPDDAPALT